MAVSVSSIVADMRTVITQLVDDLNGLHAGVSQSSLTTVMGLSKEGAVPSAIDRTTHFENDATFAELMDGHDDSSADDYLSRSVALSGGIATAAVSRCATTSVTNLDNHLNAHRVEMNKVEEGLRGMLAKLTEIQSAADESAERYPLARKSAIDLFNQGVALLESTFNKIKQVDNRIISTEEAVDARFDNGDVLATAQDQERKSLLALRDDLVGQRLKLLRRISFADDSVHLKNTSVLTLSIPSQLAVKGRGKELITMVDAFIRKAGARFKIIKFYVHRVGHDYDPVEGVYFQPPTISDGYLSVPRSFREEFRAESKDLYDEFRAQLQESGIVPALSTFKHGLSKQHTAKCERDDGVSIYFALLSLYRPSSSVFREELEAKITASPESFESGNPLQAIKPLRELLSDALQLGIRVRWTVGKRIIMILSGIQRFGSQYTLALEKFKDTASNSDDSAQHMLDMLAEVETTTKSLNTQFQMNWNSVRAHDAYGFKAKDGVSTNMCNYGTIDKCPFGKNCRYTHKDSAGGSNSNKRSASKFEGLCQAFAEDCPEPTKKTFRGREYCPTCFKRALENDGKIKARNGQVKPLKKSLVASAAKSSTKKLKKKKSKSTANAAEAAGNGTGFTDQQTDVLKACFKRSRRDNEDEDFMHAMQSSAVPAGPKGFKTQWIQQHQPQQPSNVMGRLGTTNSNANAIDQILDM